MGWLRQKKIAMFEREKPAWEDLASVCELAGAFDTRMAGVSRNG